MNMSNASNSHAAGLQCGLCGDWFPTIQDKERHLRLHCVVCKMLFESRYQLFGHMKDAHQAEAGGAVFWPLDGRTASSPGADGEPSEDDVDMIEYMREHGPTDIE